MMPLKTTIFDTSKYLDSPTSQAELVADALETGDANYMVHVLGVIARARGMTSIAKDARVTREALYKALSDDGDLRLSNLVAVLRALGAEVAAMQAATE